jgi:hypothetical protein
MVKNLVHAGWQMKYSLLEQASSDSKIGFVVITPSAIIISWNESRLEPGRTGSAENWKLKAGKRVLTKQ